MSKQTCAVCQSTDHREFPAEMNIHVPGTNAVDIPNVWVFQAIFVCMDCGAARFSVSHAKRRELVDKDDRGVADKRAA